MPDSATPEEIEIEFKEFCKKATEKEEKFVSIHLKNIALIKNPIEIHFLKLLVLLHWRSGNFSNLYFAGNVKANELEHAGEQDLP